MICKSPANSAPWIGLAVTELTPPCRVWTFGEMGLQTFTEQIAEQMGFRSNRTVFGYWDFAIKGYQSYDMVQLKWYLCSSCTPNW